MLAHQTRFSLGPPTPLRRLSPWIARAVLTLAALLACLAAGWTFSPWANNRAGQQTGRASDVDLYRAEVARMAAGEGYYAAAAAELRHRGYPTRSIFNWRTPVPLWLFAQLPDPRWGKALLIGIGLLLAALAYALAARDDAQQSPLLAGETNPSFAATGAALRSFSPTADGCRSFSLTGALLVAALTGPLLLCMLGDIYLMPELWAGVLIALSLCLYGLERRGWAVVCGLAALAVRELAFPYCLLCLAWAWRERRRGEVYGWLLGMSAYAAGYALHAAAVSGWIRPDDSAHAHGWVRCGGLGFLLATVQINAYLLVLPQWVSGLWFAAAMIGLTGWDSPAGRRIAAAAAGYAVGLSLVGQEFNQYWGAMVAPLWCFGVARFPAVLRDLISAARRATPEAACRVGAEVLG